MDEIGRMQTIDAMADASSGELTLTYRDPYAEDGPEWRRWVFESRAPDVYTESVYALSEDGWKHLALFEFRRQAAAEDSD